MYNALDPWVPSGLGHALVLVSVVLTKALQSERVVPKVLSCNS